MDSSPSRRTSAAPEKTAGPEIRQCLLMRALEEGEPAEGMPAADERIAVSKAAAAVTGGRDGLGFVRERSRRLAERLSGPASRALERVRQSPAEGGRPVWAGVAGAALAFLAGWFGSGLGPGHQVSLLAFPLLGLILWNLAVVAASLPGLLRKKRENPGFTDDGRGSQWAGVPGARHLMAAAARSRGPAGEGAWSSGSGVVDRAVERVEREWRKPQAPQRVAVLKIIFHTAALLLAAGVVAGMYARGLARNYQAGWESTFLDQSAVSKLTRIVLGPASLVTGVPVPPVPPQGGLSPAAPWIHLWAASAGLFILVPRLLLISAARSEARRAVPDWEEEFRPYEESCRRLAGDGPPLVARVLPVQSDPDSRLRDSLRAVLQHLWGGQVIVDFLPGLAYGDEESFLESLQIPPPSHLVLLVPLAVTPEEEVHGTLRRGLEAWLAQTGSRPMALAVLDAASFEARLLGMPEAARRLDSRQAVWEKVLGPYWPVLVLDAAARRNPGAAAASLTMAPRPRRETGT